jgi:hypothetical protein
VAKPAEAMEVFRGSYSQPGRFAANVEKTFAHPSAYWITHFSRTQKPTLETASIEASRDNRGMPNTSDPRLTCQFASVPSESLCNAMLITVRFSPDRSFAGAFKDEAASAGSNAACLEIGDRLDVLGLALWNADRCRTDDRLWHFSPCAEKHIPAVEVATAAD